MLRIAGWFAAMFYLIIGINLAGMSITMLLEDPAEAMPMAIVAILSVAYAANLFWRLTTPDSGPQPDGYFDADAEAANNAELAALIDMHMPSKANGPSRPPQSQDTTRSLWQ